MTSGLLLVDKPSGVTSFAVVAEVRRRYRVRQVGHAGTLDPLASGLLPILVGEATKLTPWTMGLDKVYLATVRLGVATDSYDADGRVTRTSDAAALAAIDAPRVIEALAAFVGCIRQRPPAYSAIHKDGQRLYQLARNAASRGEPVAAIEVAERDVTVHAIDLVDLAPPDLTLRIHCGKGTYVRSIAHDLGVALGVFGHVVALRRLRIGPLDVREAVALVALAPLAGGPLPPLQPLERAVQHLPALAIDDAAEQRVRMGQQAVLDALPIPESAGALRLVGADGRLVAIAKQAAPGGERRVVLARVFRAAGLFT